MAGVNFLYYCSLLDVKDWLFDLDFVDDDADTPFTDRRIRGAISRSYGEINAALSGAGWDVPVQNAVKSNNVAGIDVDPEAFVEFDVTSGEGVNFTPGVTLRIHGSDGGRYIDEFSGLVKVATDTLTIDGLEVAAVESGSTIEVCSEGFLFLRAVNAKGGAINLLSGKVVGQSKSDNSKISALQSSYESDLESIRDGEVSLDGVTSSSAIVKTWQTENPTHVDYADSCVKITDEY
jgi:hypothetical protein